MRGGTAVLAAEAFSMALLPLATEGSRAGLAHETTPGDTIRGGYNMKAKNNRWAEGLPHPKAHHKGTTLPHFKRCLHTVEAGLGLKQVGTRGGP